MLLPVANPNARRLLWLATCSLTFALAACGVESPSAESPSPSLDAPELSTRQDDLWLFPNRAWLSPVINVCWENASAANATERGWVQDATQRTWESVSRVDFVGWGNCTPGMNGIHVQIIDAQARVDFFGGDLNGRDNGMKLNFTFNNWNNNCREGSPGTTPGRRERCIRMDAVHEFGHALGFAHEQDRPEHPASCTAQTGTSAVGMHPLDVYDSASIMNYCNTDYSNRNWPIALSGSDVRGVQSVYGGQAGMVVGWWGKCMDVTGFGTANGTRIQMWDCLGGLNQRWTWSVAPFTSSFTSWQSNKHLDDPGASNANGTQLQLWENAFYGNAQSWHMGNFMIRGFLGKCLDVSNGNNVNGNPVWMWDCTGNWAQRWWLDPQARLSNQGGKCLEVAGGQSGNGAKVQIWDCHDGVNQKWYFGNDGQLRSAVDNRCLDVHAFNESAGAEVTLWDCNKLINQRWNLRGPIDHLNNKCADVRAGGTTNGTAVQVWDCLGNGFQEWDYHF